MKVKAIFTPVSKLKTLQSTDTLKTAMDLITSLGYLSLPVVDGDTYVGYLSKQFIYDEFFKDRNQDVDAFLSKKILEFIRHRVEPVSPETDVEVAANMFFKNKLRFIPVVNKDGEFEGIVTQKAIFGILTKIYGLQDPKISVYTEDIRGGLGKMAEIIAKNGGNITNVALLDTEAMGIREVSFRVVGQDLNFLRKKLEEKGYQTRS